MEDKQQGVVIQTVKYGDTSLIVKVFTRQLGLQSYMVKGVFGKSSHNRVALFQNLNIINFVQTGKAQTKSLGYLKDVEVAYVYHSAPFVMNKIAIMMFVSELLSKSITGEEQNKPFYDFIVHSLQWLDLSEQGYANFPLYFSLEVCRFLGFYPKSNYAAGSFFDLMEGQYVGQAPLHPYYLEPETALLLSHCLDKGIDAIAEMPMNVKQRRALLDGIITFMRLHAPFLKGLQSLEVLESVL